MPVTSSATATAARRRTIMTGAPRKHRDAAASLRRFDEACNASGRGLRTTRGSCIDLSSNIMDIKSTIMEDPDPAESDVNAQIARRVRQLRAARGLSLEALAERSGVSRSMISLIERGETSPTAVLLERLAAALDIALAGLFERSADAADPVARRAAQPVWRDPGSGYVRRTVSPGGAQTPIQIVEVAFPAGAHVAYDTAARQPTLHHQVWVLEGAIEVTVGTARHALAAGDCLAFVLDRPTAYRNRTRKPARYAVVVVAGTVKP
jgi:transcriptional regulator with XRE-family HTH domain